MQKSRPTFAFVEVEEPDFADSFRQQNPDLPLIHCPGFTNLNDDKFSGDPEFFECPQCESTGYVDTYELEMIKLDWNGRDVEDAICEDCAED